MDRQTILEYLRIILIAFAIAFVINILRVVVFTEWDNRPRFENITEPEPDPVQIQNNNSESQHRYNAENEAKINYDLSNGTIDIRVAPMENLSGLSKSQILEKRKNAMRTSEIFSHMNYTPSSDVYKMTDGLPWISANAALHWSKCKTDSEKTNGVSRDSIGILNPELLYFVSISENEDALTENYRRPLYKDFYFIPYRVTYNANTKTITAYIKNDKIENGSYQPIFLADSNAHDLGYKYAYMDTYENVGFYTEEPYKSNSLHSDIKETAGWYMHGSVCGVSGGCNNYAPYWLYYNDFYLRRLPASFNIKLWRQRPVNTNQEADINFKMVFE